MKKTGFFPVFLRQPLEFQSIEGMPDGTAGKTMTRSRDKRTLEPCKSIFLAGILTSFNHVLF
jgi:hypothetical protein